LSATSLLQLTCTMLSHHYQQVLAPYTCQNRWNETSDGSSIQWWLRTIGELYFPLTFFVHPNVHTCQCQVYKDPHIHSTYNHKRVGENINEKYQIFLKSSAMIFYLSQPSRQVSLFIPGNYCLALYYSNSLSVPNRDTV
jgi:hypothetical protein